MSSHLPLRTIETCRVCGSSELASILSLGSIYVSDFVTDRTVPSPDERYPLELVLCDPEKGGCCLLQLKHSVDPSKMYNFYYYHSGTNAMMREALTDITRQAARRVSLKKEDTVLDIGCNDGTLLRSYPQKGLRLVGFDPAKNLVPEARVGTHRILNDYFNYDAFNKAFPGKKAKVITSIAMFYDLDEPNAFVADAARCLHPEGLWIIQMSYLPLMLEQNAFDNICVKPDTLILGDNKPIKDLSGNEQAVCGNGKLTGIKRVMNRAYDGNLVSVKPMYLEPIVTTPNHPLQIVKKEFLRFDCHQLKSRRTEFKKEWVRADEIKRGDWVIVPRLAHGRHPMEISLKKFNKTESVHYRRGMLSFQLTEEMAWMLGLYVAEGHVGGRENNPYLCFTLHQKEKQIVQRLSGIFGSLGYKCQVISPRPNVRSVDVRVVCAALCRAFREWFGKRAPQKRIPDFILFAQAEIKIYFLRGLFEGDGYIRNNKVHFHTASKILALQTQLLAASLGGTLGISYVKPYPRMIRGGRVDSKDSWQLRGSSRTLADIFGFSYSGKDITHAIVENDSILVPVKSVGKEAYKGYVHNIETGHGTYLVSNAVVHNCHEHLEYYSMFSLGNLLKRHGLKAVDVELNDVNGGSFRVYIRHWDAVASPQGARRVAELKGREKKQRLDEKETYIRFGERVLAIREKLYHFIHTEVKKGKTVYAYGASTKGNTLLQYFNLDASLIEGAVERNPDKFGKKTVGTMIPILSEEEARARKPDYFLVLPWHFLKVFLKQEARFFKSGGRFIVPLPQMKILPPLKAKPRVAKT